MIQLRKAAERGRTRIGWLDSAHTFSFGDYYDPRNMGFRSLRVMNDDRIEPGQGFGTHPHRDMEILTYVLDGALAHRDSLGSSSIIQAGELQRMTAGTGISHSEFNASATDPVHLYQIWIFPERKGLTPGYEQRQFASTQKPGQWHVVASRDGRDDSLTIHQDASVSLGSLRAGDALKYKLAPSRHAWVQALRGRFTIDGRAMEAGDGAAISDESELSLAADGNAEVMLFDLA
jgi:redox-sensitive bicupin YhaK (pirin superfamily)